MRGHRSIDEAGRHIEPAFAIGLHDERVVACKALRTFRVALGFVVRRFVRNEVRDIVAVPLSAVAVPPDQSLALAPRLTVGVCGGPVVKDPAIRGPGPTPLRAEP